MKRSVVLLIAVVFTTLLVFPSTSPAGAIINGLPGPDALPAQDTWLHTPDGTVELMGIPFLSNPLPSMGNTDTIIRRSGDDIPELGTGDIAAEIVALSLVSAAPVNLAPFGLPNVNALIHVGLDETEESSGTIQITSHSSGPDGGGGFVSWFDFVYGEFSYLADGDKVILGTEPITLGVAASGNQWSHVRPAGYVGPMSSWYPVGTVRHDGPHPETEHSTPEPASVIVWSLLGAVAVGSGLWRRRHRRA